jgi:hypothetical protein
MNDAQLIEKLQNLPTEKQVEVSDFVEFLAERFSCTTLPNYVYCEVSDFSELSTTEAMRGLENETALYTEADIKERWQ